MYCTRCGHANPEGARFCGKCGAPLRAAEARPAAGPSVGAPPAAAAGVEYMGFWIRLVAALIDGLICIPLFFFTLIGPYLYFWLMTGLRGQTSGKMAVGIKVVDMDGKNPGLGKAFLREIVGRFISGLFLYLGYLWIAWDREKQGWHDKIAGTYVVRARR